MQSPVESRKPKAESPTSLSSRLRRIRPAVDDDVVAAALRLVRAVGIDVVIVSLADILVIAAPGVLGKLLDDLGDQLGEGVGERPVFDPIDVDGVGELAQVESRG